jgi:DNA-binding HxlR family transcriptional regulator
MDARRYEEFCAVATALDVVGERWTLLVIRELLPGPKRYSDLREGLPGIASNLLANRLRALEERGLVARRRLPPPAASTIYELTDVGRGLEPVLLDLARWGSRWMTVPAADTVVRASWFALAVKSLVTPLMLGTLRADIAIESGDEFLHLRVADGAVDVMAEPLADPDARLIADPRTLFRIGSGASTIHDEIAAGHASVDGRPGAVQLLSVVLRFR